MNPSEQQLLEQEVGTTGVRMHVSTGTRIDAGQWWRRRPVQLAVTGSELVLFAVGRRRYCERIALHDCHGSFYNPASGELVIAPENTLRFPRLKMPASTAIRLIELIKSPPPTSNTTSP